MASRKSRHRYAISSRRANDKIFAATIATQVRYDGGNAAKANIRHLPTMIKGQGAQGKPKPSMLSVTDMDQVTIEHIYPQNANPADPQLTPNVHRLGNPFLLGKVITAIRAIISSQ